MQRSERSQRELSKSRDFRCILHTRTQTTLRVPRFWQIKKCLGRTSCKAFHAEAWSSRRRHGGRRVRPRRTAGVPRRRRLRRRPTQRTSSNSRSATSRSSRCTTASGRRRTTRAFIKNASLDETKAALKAGGLTDAHVPIPFTVTAVQHQGQARAVRLRHRRSAGARRPVNITKNDVWKAAGIDPAKVDTIVVTHFHPRSHQRPDGQGHQRADLPECRRSTCRPPSTSSGPIRRRRRAPPSASRRCSRAGRTSQQFEGDKEVVPGVKRHRHQRPHAGSHQLPASVPAARQLIVLGDVTNIPALVREATRAGMRRSTRRPDG